MFGPWRTEMDHRKEDHVRKALELYKGGHYRRALSLVREASTALEFEVKAICKKKLGEKRAARDAYEAALRLEPDNTRLLYGLGVCECELSRPNRGQELFAKAIEAGMDD